MFVAKEGIICELTNENSTIIEIPIEEVERESLRNISFKFFFANMTLRVHA